MRENLQTSKISSWTFGFTSLCFKNALICWRVSVVESYAAIRRCLNQPKCSCHSFAQADLRVLLENHNHRNHLLYLRIEKKCPSTITGKKFDGFYAIRKKFRKNFWWGGLKSFHPESLGAWWKHSSRREHFILGSNLLSVHAKGNLYPPSLLNCKEKTVLRHDLKQIAKFFSESADSKEWGSAIPLIHHIPKLNVSASTGILNLGIRKPCLLISSFGQEEVVASRVILLKMTVRLLGTHSPIPMNAARALRLFRHEKHRRCPIAYRRTDNSV